MKTKYRKGLEERDELGVNETFEARIRRALTPWQTLIDLLSLENINFEKYQDIITELRNRKHLDKVLRLLEYSENDRGELS